MPESIHDPQLAARLVEIDRKLRTIQAELRPGAEGRSPRGPERPRAPSSPPQAAPQPTGREGPLADLLQRVPRQQRLAGEELLRRFEQLAAVQADVVASLRDLLDGFDRTLGQLADATSDEVAVSAGPFSTIADVHDFVSALGTLPGVEDAALRGFEGADYALVEVRLGRTNPYPSR